MLEDLKGHFLGPWEDQEVLAVLKKKLLVLQGVQEGLEAFEVQLGV